MIGGRPPGGHRPVSGIKLLLITTGVLALVLTGLLIPIPFLGRAADATGDLVHAPLFAALTLGALVLLDRVRPVTQPGSGLALRTVIVLAGIVAFATATEATQKFLGRTATVQDALSNALGATAGALWYWSFQWKRNDAAKPFIRYLSLAAAVALVAIAWRNPLGTLLDVLAVHRDFPVLASFESPRQLERFYFRHSQPRLTRQDATDGQFAMEVCYQVGPEPRVTLTDLKPDWSALQTLQMDVTLDASCTEPNISLVVKVVDRSTTNWDTDAFRRIFVLEAGQPQHIRISRQDLMDGPDTRQLDLSKIRFVTLYPLDPVGTTKLRVDAIKLTLHDSTGK